MATPDRYTLRWWRLIGVPLAALLLVTPACSPCAGVLDCQSETSVLVEGRIVDAATGKPAGNVHVTVDRDAESVETITAKDGVFGVRLRLGSTADSALTVRVTPPAGMAYTERSLSCPVIRVRGAGCPLPWLTTRPAFRAGGFVYYRGADQHPVDATPVIFRRTSGVSMVGLGVSGDSLTFAVDADAGHINLFPAGVFASDAGQVTGDLIVHLPPPLDSGVVRDLQVEATARFQYAPPPAIILVGPSLKTSLAFVDDADRPVKGVVIQLVRQGGILADAGRFTATSDDSGRAVLDPRPFSRGTLQGAILVDATAVGGVTFTIANVALETDDDDDRIDLGRWNVASGMATVRQRR